MFMIFIVLIDIENKIYLTDCIYIDTIINNISRFNIFCHIMCNGNILKTLNICH